MFKYYGKTKGRRKHSSEIFLTFETISISKRIDNENDDDNNNNITDDDNDVQINEIEKWQLIIPNDHILSQHITLNSIVKFNNPNPLSSLSASNNPHLFDLSSVSDISIYVQLIKCAPYPNSVLLLLSSPLPIILPSMLNCNQEQFDEINKVKQSNNILKLRKLAKIQASSLSSEIKVDVRKNKNRSKKCHIHKKILNILDQIEGEINMNFGINLKEISNNDEVSHSSDDISSMKCNNSTTSTNSTNNYYNFKNDDNNINMSNEELTDQEEILYNIPGSIHEKSSRGNMTRGEYIHLRKTPQINWIITRLKQMELDRNVSYSHILDVGGGRGDLACSIAKQLNAKVSVMDINETSLSAGIEFAKKSNVENKMNFIYQDFNYIINNIDNDLNELDKDKLNNSKKLIENVDCIVGFHTCGILTDMLLEYVTLNQSNSIDFLLVPCCYLKDNGSKKRKWYEECHTCKNSTEDRIILQKLCESNNRNISFRSMKALNNMRLNSVAKDLIINNNNNNQMKISLESFNESYSLKNLILIGNK
jgi:hypothetical protein